VGRRAHRLAAEVVDNLFLPGKEALVVKEIVVIQHFDHFLQLVGRQDLADSLRVGFLDVDERMVAVEVREDKICRRRHDERLGEMRRVAQADERLAFLLDGK
jgi:hypothetical protein